MSPNCMDLELWSPGRTRLDPVGASVEEEQSEPLLYSRLDQESRNKIKTLEEERDLLQSALLDLTTHFAQVQLRLRQIVEAPAKYKGDLLKSLEQFAFEGVENQELLGRNDLSSDQEFIRAQRLMRKQQDELVKLLRAQVHKLKSFDCCEDKLSKTVDYLVRLLQVKEDVEKQLKVQIIDLERFVAYLKSNSSRCFCENKKGTRHTRSVIDCLRQYIQETSSFLKLFAMINIDCFRRYLWQKTYKNNHWGDLRAELELAIIKVKNLVRNNQNPKRVLSAVRTQLASSIKELMHHGLKPQNSNTLVPISFDCFSSSYSDQTHGWEVILDYYHSKEGDKFNSSAKQKLATSFNIDISGASTSSSKKNLLCAIGQIISTHSPYKRSRDSHFRAFVCAGLNANRLATWLNLIFQCSHIIKVHYHPWSYAAKTRYQDGVRSLDVLTGYKFDLPVDLEVEKFRNVEIVSSW